MTRVEIYRVSPAGVGRLQDTYLLLGGEGEIAVGIEWLRNEYAGGKYHLVIEKLGSDK